MTDKISYASAMEKTQTIRTVSRALQILKAINRLDAPTLTEISRATSLPYATTFRLVHALIEEGMIEQEPFRKRYIPTEQVHMLSSGFQEDDQLLRAALEPMNEYTRENLWPVALTVRVGNRMMIKYSTNKLTTQTFENYYSGETVPLLFCSSGRAYLAFCGDEERKAIIDGLKANAPDAREPILKVFDDGGLINEITEAGYASYARTQHNKNPGKTSAFAVPIMVGGSLKGCLTLVFFAEAHSMRDAVGLYLEPIKELADTIASRIAV